MHRLTIDDHFSAAHAILINGVREPLHGHDWKVRLTLQGEQLDHDGLLIDFHAAHALLREIIGPFHNANLNQTTPFDRVNPTAENVAEHIAREFSRRFQTLVRERSKNAPVPPVHVRCVRVREAVGCTAAYYPDQV